LKQQNIQLQERNNQLQLNLESVKEVISNKPVAIDQSIQTIELVEEVPQQQNISTINNREEILEQEFQKYLKKHQLTIPTLPSSQQPWQQSQRYQADCETQTDSVLFDITEELEDLEQFTREVESELEEEDDEANETTSSNEERLNIEFARKYLKQSYPLFKQPTPSESDYSENDSSRELFSDDSLLDVIQALEDQQHKQKSDNKKPIERSSIDTISSFSSAGSSTVEMYVIRHIVFIVLTHCLLSHRSGPLWFEQSEFDE
jgi:hypothetical protein